MVLLGQLRDKLAVSVKVPFSADQHRVGPLLRHRCEDTPESAEGVPLSAGTIEISEMPNRPAGVPQGLARKNRPTPRAWPEMQLLAGRRDRLF